MNQNHHAAAQNLQERKKQFGRGASPKPNPSITEMPQKKETNQIETVEDIQESVCFMSNEKPVKENGDMSPTVVFTPQLLDKK